MILNMSREQIRELIGDPVTVDQELQEFRNSALLFSKERPRLIDEYPRKWVGVFKGSVQADADTLRDLLRKLDEKKIPRSSVVVRYIDKTIRTMVL
jgi:hypothetical protein